MQPLTDTHTLIDAAKGGDRQALSRLLEHHRPLLKAEALRRLGHNNHAEDAVQETFLTAILKLEQLRKPAKFRSWIFSILCNVCRRIQREKQRQSTYLAPERANKQATPESIEKELEHRELQLWIRELLDTLTEKQRAVILLRYFSQCDSYKLIAKVLSIPVGTVRSRLHQAREMLKKRLPALDPASIKTSESPVESSIKFYKDLWSDFYAGNRKRFLNYYHKDLVLRFTSGAYFKGRERWAEEWDYDLEIGVRFRPEHAITSGSISLVEGPFINPPHDPFHCPPSGSFILFHGDEKVNRVHLHYAERTV